ncbi:hypothetical protein BZA05DRAFT_416059 [Tricharina praecox]|uniref:uncharacterized protein n=1 Tax=Tricharina praecox TaxID=43433 RepID=UPI002220C238|nr:uncharacterized protein BZA05DRAFT_416059 [Tricharina praecox]KAI5856365.1 hypothetical protein BZA05DRAFT_416059 [Tricharina praecox]
MEKSTPPHPHKKSMRFALPDKEHPIAAAGDRSRPVSKAGDRSTPVSKAGDRSKPVSKAGDRSRTASKAGDSHRSKLPNTPIANARQPSIPEQQQPIRSLVGDYMRFEDTMRSFSTLTLARPDIRHPLPARPPIPLREIPFHPAQRSVIVAKTGTHETVRAWAEQFGPVESCSLYPGMGHINFFRSADARRCVLEGKGEWSSARNVYIEIGVRVGEWGVSQEGGAVGHVDSWTPPQW